MIADSVHTVQHICTFLSNSKTRDQTVCSYKLSKTRLTFSLLSLKGIFPEK